MVPLQASLQMPAKLIFEFTEINSEGSMIVRSLRQYALWVFFNGKIKVCDM